MKLSNVTAKLTYLKQNVVRVLTVATLAGAALTAVAVAPAAQAQRVGFGVVIGGPRYYAPAPPVVVYHGPAFGVPAYPAYGAYYRGYDRDDYRHFDAWHDRDRFDHRDFDHHDRDDHRGWDRR